MLVDSHCHLDRLDLTRYGGNLDQAIKFAEENQVMHMLCVSVDILSAPVILSIAEKYPNVYASIGLHPTEIVDEEPDEAKLIALANHPKVIAIGETGLDYFHKDTDPLLQQQRFRCHIRAARHINKPLIIHTRDAAADTLAILQEENADQCKGVMHCFTESFTVAEQAMQLGFYISFSGIVTFQNARELKQTAQQVPLDRMLIETDSPYLAPVPYRGKPNEPAYVRYVAECIAELKNVSYNTVAKQTTRNFFDLFQLP